MIFVYPSGVRPITQRLQEAGYQTANVTHIGDQVVGTGKLDLNFVNEGQLYQTKLWSEIDTSRPFFAQFNMPEAEYDIYDRKSAEKKRVPWVGEEWHPKIATPGKCDAAALLSRPPNRPRGMGQILEFGQRHGCADRMDSRATRTGWSC